MPDRMSLGPEDEAARERRRIWQSAFDGDPEGGDEADELIDGVHQHETNDGAATTDSTKTPTTDNDTPASLNEEEEEEEGHWPWNQPWNQG